MLRCLRSLQVTVPSLLLTLAVSLPPTNTIWAQEAPPSLVGHTYDGRAGGSYIGSGC